MRNFDFCQSGTDISQSKILYFHLYFPFLNCKNEVFCSKFPVVITILGQLCKEKKKIEKYKITTLFLFVFLILLSAFFCNF